MKKLLIPTVFLLSIALAVMTRFYMLGTAPKGLYLDEAGQGYSAYSILTTGADEFGKKFPIVFRSFTDFKTPVYIYCIVPLIPFFGLTPFTVRFPSFFFSILTFPVLYLLIRELSPKKTTIPIALLSLVLLSISPWHILFGRTNFECNVALFFFLSACLMFYKGLRYPKLLVISAVLFAIAIPAYHAQRIVTPLTIFILFVRHKKILLGENHKTYFFAGAFLGALLLLPTLSIIGTPGFLARANGLNIFSHLHQNPSGFLNYNGVFVKLVNNSLFLSTKEFLSLYVSYFAPREIFLLGDSGLRSSFPYLGTFFIWQLPFYIIGLYSFFKEKNRNELHYFFGMLLFISPIPAALTRDPYSTIRSLQMVVPLTLIISLGLYNSFSYLKQRYSRLKTPYFLFVFSLVILFSIAKLYSSIIILNEYYRGVYWNLGWEQVAIFVMNKKDNLEVIVDNARDEPYIQLAFFLKYPPDKFQLENFEVSSAEYYTNMNRNKDKTLGNIKTRVINWEEDLKKEEYLVGDALSISDPQVREHNLKLISDIYYPNGEIAIRIVKTPHLTPVKR